MFILDTDTLTLLFKGHPRVLEKRVVVPASEIAVTIVTRIEVLQGRFDFLLKAATGEDLLRAQAHLDATVVLLSAIDTVLPINDAAAAAFDRLRRNKNLKKIGRNDMLIASIALANRAPLVTRNVKDFQHVPELRLVNWAD